jgi:hypothetical protein
MIFQLLKVQSLKVGRQCDAGDAAVAVARVLFANGAKFLTGASLLGQDCPGDGDDFLFAVSSVAEQGRAPGVAPACTTCDEDSGSSKLAGKVVEEIVGL